MKMQGGIGDGYGDGGLILPPVVEDARCMEPRETAPPTPSNLPPPGMRLMQQAAMAAEELQHQLVSGTGDMALVILGHVMCLWCCRLAEAAKSQPCEQQRGAAAAAAAAARLEAAVAAAAARPVVLLFLQQLSKQLIRRCELYNIGSGNGQQTFYSSAAIQQI
jgi:hypothetical protein